METDNWPLLDSRGISFRSHAHSLVKFLRETERIVALRGKDSRHQEVVRAKCMEFALRAEREPGISDVMSKLEKLEGEAKIQQDYSRKIDQTLAGLGGNIKSTSKGTQAWKQAHTGPVSPPKSISHTYNHQNQVVVKLNSKEVASMLELKSSEELTEMVNGKLLETNTTDKQICIAKISKGGNIAIQPVDNTEAQNLRININWVWAAFGGEAELITRLYGVYGVVGHGVSVLKVNPKSKDASILYLEEKNRSAFPGLSIKWIGWLRSPQEGKSVASLIIEVADPEVANRMIDEGIVTGAQMHSCTRYSPDCRMKQCFKCLQYGHNTS